VTTVIQATKPQTAYMIFEYNMINSKTICTSAVYSVWSYTSDKGTKPRNVIYFISLYKTQIMSISVTSLQETVAIIKCHNSFYSP